MAPPVGAGASPQPAQGAGGVSVPPLRSSARPGLRPSDVAAGGRAWPCACGGQVEFSAAALVAYRDGDGADLLTMEQWAHDRSPRHTAWRRARAGWRWDAYERRVDLYDAFDGKLPSNVRESGREPIPLGPPACRYGR